MDRRLHHLRHDRSNHAVSAKTFATIAARDADIAWSGKPANLHKVVYITDAAAFQVLVGVGPAAWQDLSGAAVLLLEAGIGITGAAESYSMNVTRFGNLIKTEILIDLTGLTSTNTDDDIIGDEGIGVAHLGQILAARNGTIYKGVMSCLETPLTGDDQVALWAADTGTGVEDTSITAQTNQNELEQSDGDGTAWVIGAEIAIADGLPTAGQYIYLVVDGAGVVGTYTAGKFLIEFWGYA